MATIHHAALTPSKLDLIGDWLARQSWAPRGPVERIAAYRLDDPAGRVGIEGLLLAVGESRLHVPVTYRGAPIEGADTYLIGTTEHSVLGQRWVYDAAADPVAVRVLLATILTGGEQAKLELWEDGVAVGTRDPDMTVKGSGDAGYVPTFDGVSVRSLGAIASVGVMDYVLDIVRVIGETVTGTETLFAVWPHGEGVLAAVRQVH